MAHTKPEKEVQTEIIKYAKSNGWYCIKVIRGNSNGIHDLILCIDSKFVSCEVKAEKFVEDPYKQASEWQMKHLKMVKDAKGVAMVVASLDQFKVGIAVLTEDYSFLD